MAQNIQTLKLNKSMVYVSDHSALRDNSSEELGDIVRISRFKEKATNDRNIDSVSMEMEWEMVVNTTDSDRGFNLRIKIHRMVGKVIYEDWEPNIPEEIDDLLDIFSDKNDREYDEDEMDLVQYVWNLDTGNMDEDGSEWKYSITNEWNKRASEYEGTVEVHPDYIEIDIASKTIYIEF